MDNQPDAPKVKVVRVVLFLDWQKREEWEEYLENAATAPQNEKITVAGRQIALVERNAEGKIIRRFTGQFSQYPLLSSPNIRLFGNFDLWRFIEVGKEKGEDVLVDSYVVFCQNMLRIGAYFSIRRFDTTANHKVVDGGFNCTYNKGVLRGMPLPVPKLLENYVREGENEGKVVKYAVFYHGRWTICNPITIQIVHARFGVFFVPTWCQTPLSIFRSKKRGVNFCDSLAPRNLCRKNLQRLIKTINKRRHSPNTDKWDVGINISMNTIAACFCEKNKFSSLGFLRKVKMKTIVVIPDRFSNDRFAEINLGADNVCRITATDSRRRLHVHIGGLDFDELGEDDVVFIHVDDPMDVEMLKSRAKDVRFYSVRENTSIDSPNSNQNVRELTTQFASLLGTVINLPTDTNIVNVIRFLNSILVVE